MKRNSEQSYEYDEMDRLESSTGKFDYETWNPFWDKRVNTYTNEFDYNVTGKILHKTQENKGLLTETNETVTIAETTYDWAYEYSGSHPNAVTRAGTREFNYDLNGNMTQMTDTAKSLTRTLNWDDENRLKKTTDSPRTPGGGNDVSIVTTYEYDASGIRALKKGKYGTVQYVSDNYTVRNKDLVSKHVFAGNTRLVSKVVMNEEKSGKMVATEQGSYYYHADHLGSSSVVTDKSGKFYEHLEYFPYGETWVHNKATSEQTSTPYKFTSKELDEETGNYYHGARYYDPRLSRWISADPAVSTGEYFPTSDKKRNANLPGMGGIFNSANLDAYQYAHNNPARYTDPDGRVTFDQKTKKLVAEPGGSDPNKGSQNGGNASGGGSKGNWSSPIKGFDAKKGNGLSSDFGERNIVPKLHKGIDIVASNGTPIYAAQDGKISYGVDNYIDENGDKRGYGNYAVIKGTNGISSRYGHMNEDSVSFLPDGSDVIAGKTIIGYVGNTGNSKGNHLHFEIFNNGLDQNPYQNVPYIPVGDKIFYNPRRFLEDME